MEKWEKYAYILVEKKKVLKQTVLCEMQGNTLIAHLGNKNSYVNYFLLE